MTKTELVQETATESGLTQPQVNAVLDALSRIVFRELADDSKQKIPLFGIGVISTALRAARIGRNPRTGMPINIKERTAIVFRPTGRLKLEVNK